jgi:hypothetical protein
MAQSQALVAHTILATREAEIGRIAVQGQIRQLVARPHLNQYLGIVALVYHSKLHRRLR